MNVVCLLGRMVAEPELKHTQSGVAVCSFRIAVDRTYQVKGQERQADFINLVAWRNTAEFVCRYFHKGQRIALNGSLQTREYTDRDGNKRTAFEVVCDNVPFADSRTSGAAGGNYGGNYGGYAPAQDSQIPTYNESQPAFSTAASGDFEEIVGDDELPF